MTAINPGSSAVLAARERIERAARSMEAADEAVFAAQAGTRDEMLGALDAWHDARSRWVAARDAFDAAIRTARDASLQAWHARSVP